MATDTGKNRRYKLGLIFFVLLNITFYLCLFMGKDLAWYTAYAKDQLVWFGVIVGGLTLTDLGYYIKEGWKKNGEK